MEKKYFKHIYVPDKDELYMMQEMGANVYKYIFVKVIELLTLEGVICSNKGILRGNYKYLMEDPDLVKAVCRMYPDEMKDAEFTRNDIGLCMSLISGEDRTIYSLDNLARFDIDVLSNMELASQVINKLYLSLRNNPKYRFEYANNYLLDMIFSGRYLEELFYNTDMLEKLISIEPMYALKYDPAFDVDKIGLLRQSVNEYARRYGLREDLGIEYKGKDIISNPDLKVKRLMKTFKTHYDYRYEQPLTRK